MVYGRRSGVEIAGFLCREYNAALLIGRVAGIAVITTAIPAIDSKRERLCGIKSLLMVLNSTSSTLITRKKR
jgi:hypothetical protein